MTKITRRECMEFLAREYYDANFTDIELSVSMLLGELGSFPNYSEFTDDELKDEYKEFFNENIEIEG